MNQEVLDRVLKSPRLPSLPTIALEVIELVQQKDVPIKQIAYTIQHDPALSSKILRTVNSSFYGQAKSVSTISHALVVLGLNSVKTLALGFSLVANLQDSGGEGFDHIAFWRRSLYAAAGAKALAKATGNLAQEETFLGGLLQDLGVLAMTQALGDEYTDLLAQAGQDHGKLLELEQQAYECNHAEVGAALAESWKLPPQLIAPIRHHVNPDQTPAPFADLVRCVVIGNSVAELFMSEGACAQALEEYYAAAQTSLGLNRPSAEPLLKEIHKQTSEMSRLFDLPTGELGNPDEILAQANEALTALSLQQTNQLEQEKQKLLTEANTDPLTGVANRRRFNEYIAEQFDLVAGGAGDLSVLFLDTDHFKNFNDTYGHAVGDRVLVQLGKTLTAAMPDAGLVSRYGGEEFAVVLPATSRRDAARLAEQLRQQIEHSSVMSDDGEALHITASIGVSTFEGVFFDNVEQLVKAADQGVYAAKAAGRNCVRIFTPRPAKPQAAA